MTIFALVMMENGPINVGGIIHIDVPVNNLKEVGSVLR